MENENKSVVYIYSSWAVLNLNIILPFYLPLFWLFLSSSSYYKYAILFHSMHIFPIQKKLSLSQFFFIFCYYFSCIFTMD